MIILFIVIILLCALVTFVCCSMAFWKIVKAIYYIIFDVNKGWEMTVKDSKEYKKFETNLNKGI